jgi:hypothetical protein
MKARFVSCSDFEEPNYELEEVIDLRKLHQNLLLSGKTQDAGIPIDIFKKGENACTLEEFVDNPGLKEYKILAGMETNKKTGFETIEEAITKLESSAEYLQNGINIIKIEIRKLKTLVV